MKKFFSVLLLAPALLAAVNVSAQGKVGYISSSELVSIMPETKKADSTLQEIRNLLVANATEKQNTFYAAIDQFNKDSVTMTDARKTVKRAELTKMGQDLSGEEERIQQQLQAKQQELLVPINKKAMDAIQSVAKENGYNYVLEKEAVIVGPPGDDILQLVAKKLNIKVPIGGAAPPASRPAGGKP